MRRATINTLQPHKYCACHAKWISWLIRITYETSFTMRGATVNTVQPHQILRLPRKMSTQHLTEICWKQVKRTSFPMRDRSEDRSENDPTQKMQNWTRSAAKGTFRAHQEQILLKITTFPAPAIIPNPTTCCTCHKKMTHEFYQMLHQPQKVGRKLHQMLHLPQKVTHKLHQMLHLPQKVIHKFHQMLPLPQKKYINFTKCCTCHKK